MPKLVPYSKGSVIFFSGDKDERIFILQSGTVTLKYEDIVTGEEFTEQLEAGEFFGVKSALARRPRIETASAKTDVQAVQLSVQEFEKSFLNRPDRVMLMLMNFVKSLADTRARMEKLLHFEQSEQVPPVGMEQIARTFYKDGGFHACVSECERALAAYPDAENRENLSKLLEKAKSRLSEEPSMDIEPDPNEVEDEAEEQSAREASTLKQFSSPVFQRFSKDYADGEVIISEFEDVSAFYIIQSGNVVVDKCMNSLFKRYDILHAGDLLGATELINDSPRTATAVARGAVTCLRFGKENFNKLIVEKPEIASQQLKLMCKRFFDWRRQIKLLCITDTAVRIADLFLIYDTIPQMRKPLVEDDEEKRTFYLTIPEISRWIAVPLEKTRDELNKYVSKNKVSIYDNYMIVRNIMDMKRTVDSYYANKEEEDAAKAAKGNKPVKK